MHFRELADRYSLEKILRSSRGGTVLRAVDSRSGQSVAIKLIPVGSPAALVQLAPQLDRLAAVLAEIRHPNLPAVIDSGFTTDGSAFLVMELLEGKTLDHVSGPPLRPLHIVGLLFQALNGLEALACRGLAHLNVSPDNLLVTGPPEAEQVKILGLGSALFRAAVPAEAARFQAPELSAPGAGKPDWHADLYSFALTCCSALGATVRLGDAPSVQLPFALTLELESCEGFLAILERCLRKNPGERPSHQEIRDAFRMTLGAAAPAPSGERPVVPKLVIPVQPQPATVPAPAVPAPALLPEPADGELLPAITDEFLDSLAAVSPSRPPAEAAAPQAAPQGRVAMAAALRDEPTLVRTARSRRLAVALASVAGVLVLGAGAAFWWLNRAPAAEPPPAPAPAVAAAPEPPRRPAAEVLQEAQLALADGDDGRAFQILRSLSAADQASLSPASCRALRSLEETLTLAALERLPVDLEDGLKTGNLSRLRLAVAASEGQDASLPEPVRASLGRAREVLGLYEQVEDAAARKAHLEVLDKFAVLAAQVPGASDPAGARGQAAAAVESEAESLAGQGMYDQALARLEPLVRTWPDRPGLEERIAAYEGYRKNDEEQQVLLADLSAAERRKKPHEGLERLRGIEPVPHLAPLFAEARQKLEAQLRALDGKAPKIELRDGYVLYYDRGQAVELSFRVTDDYELTSVKMMARPEGGKMREMELVRSNFGYTVEIPPAFHRNGAIDFYVVATDPSGHEGWFGTPDKPQKVERRQGFEQLVQ